MENVNIWVQDPSRGVHGCFPHLAVFIEILLKTIKQKIPVVPASSNGRLGGSVVNGGYAKEMFYPQPCCNFTLTILRTTHNFHLLQTKYITTQNVKTSQSDHTKVFSQSEIRFHYGKKGLINPYYGKPDFYGMYPWHLEMISKRSNSSLCGSGQRVRCGNIV